MDARTAATLEAVARARADGGEAWADLRLRAVVAGIQGGAAKIAEAGIDVEDVTTAMLIVGLSRLVEADGPRTVAAVLRAIAADLEASDALTGDEDTRGTA